MCIWYHNEKGELLFVGDNEPELVVSKNQGTCDINKEQIEKALYDALMRYANNPHPSICNMKPRRFKDKI